MVKVVIFFVVVLFLVGCGGVAPKKQKPVQTVPPTQSAPAAPPPSQQTLSLTQIGNFNSPIYVAAPTGDNQRVFVIERGGVIRIIQNGQLLPQPFLDISSDVATSGEQGLLTMAFAPDYQSSGLFYVYYSSISDHASKVAEFSRSSTNPNQANAQSRRLVISIPQPAGLDNHKGGQLQFGPDGLLYIGLGDGGSEGDPHGNGQNLSTLLGKILRINPRPSGSQSYQIPPDNPFVNKSGARPEIYAYGLRNPWRFSFDRLTGDMIIADVGQNRIEEVNFEPKGQARGANFGWNVFEGDERFAPGNAPGAVFPVLQQFHSAGYCAIIGGYVVRDKTLPQLYGNYIYGDLCLSQLRAVKLSPGNATGDRALPLSVSTLDSFGEDAQGHIYAVSLNGPVYMVTSH